MPRILGRTPSGLLAVFLSLLATQAVAQEVVYRPVHEGPHFVGYVRDEIVVVMGSGSRDALEGGLRVRDEILQAILAAHGVDSVRRQFAQSQQSASLEALSGHYKVRVGDPAQLDALIEALERTPTVDHVERIGIHTTFATPNDPYYQGSPNPNFNYDQWHYWDTHGVGADQAWDINDGDPNVIVGILDSGVRYFHRDLGGNSAQWGPGAPFAGGNIWIHPSEIPNNGVDDDNNGFVDDTIGWDFVSNASSAGVTCLDADCADVDNDPDDGDGHGTHVAGTVGAMNNNGILVAGVAGGFGSGSATSVGNGVKVLPLRIGFLGRFQGITGGLIRMDWAAEAMAYVAALVDAGHNVTAINCSWGSSNSGGLDAAVNALIARDVLVVHAAGNSNSTSADFLGGKAGVMNVAATSQSGAGASFSNHGSWVDVAAPGDEILSTYANPDDPVLTNHYIALLGGTSMAAPHICGIAALLESCDPTLSATDKFNLITGNTTPYADTRNLGSGIANANLAMLAAGCSAPCDIGASFTALPDSGSVPHMVNFTDTSAGSPTGWEWDFGDGNGSTLQHPVHEYQDPGVFDVSLIVQSACGADSLLEGVTITVTDTTTVVDAPLSRSPLRARSYPNPFNPRMILEFEIAQSGLVHIDIYDASGRQVRRLLDRQMDAGIHRQRFDGRDDAGAALSAGTYFYRIVAGKQRATGKFVLVK